MNPLANGECGAWLTPTFGVPLPLTPDPARGGKLPINPDILEGWGVRPSDWQLGVSIQQEVLPRVSAEVGYHRRWFNGFTITDNLLSTAADYTPYSFTAPQHASLPGGGGYTVSSVDPNRVFSPVGNYTMFADEYGETIQYWHGIDLNINARMRNGLVVQGGTSTGRGVRDNCEVTAKVPELLLVGLGPAAVWQQASSCRVVEPWLTQARGLIAYNIPKIDVAISASFQLKPGTLGILGNEQATNGASLAANYVVTNATALPSLGRNLTAGQNTVNLLVRGRSTAIGSTRWTCGLVKTCASDGPGRWWRWTSTTC